MLTGSLDTVLPTKNNANVTEDEQEPIFTVVVAGKQHRKDERMCPSLTQDLEYYKAMFAKALHCKINNGSVK